MLSEEHILHYSTHSESYNSTHDHACMDISWVTTKSMSLVMLRRTFHSDLLMLSYDTHLIAITTYFISLSLPVTENSDDLSLLL